MKILIFGASGMLGSTLFRYFSRDKNFQVWGTFRQQHLVDFPSIDMNKMIQGVQAQDHESIQRAFKRAQPEVVINCIGLIKQLPKANDPLEAITINALLPHQLAYFCKIQQARFIHISTDCVFSGNQGSYKEEDLPDATDLYGRSKLLGEVTHAPALTIRTSMIGHELHRSASLIDWFLAQQNEVQGFKHAVFSGLPTIEIAHIIQKIITEWSHLSGLYHVAAKPINKFDLLQLVAKIYGKDIRINENTQFVLDRSLDGSRFNRATGYQAPAWPVLIKKMFEFQNMDWLEVLEAV